MKKFIILNQSGNLATSSEGAVHETQPEAEGVVGYLKAYCDLADEEFTVHEAEITIGKEVSRFPAIHVPTKCQECGESYSNEDYGHDYDAIEEYGKCTDCIGECPYCDTDTH